MSELKTKTSVLPFSLQSTFSHFRGYPGQGKKHVCTIYAPSQSKPSQPGFLAQHNSERPAGRGTKEGTWKRTGAFLCHKREGPALATTSVHLKHSRAFFHSSVCTNTTFRQRMRLSQTTVRHWNRLAAFRNCRDKQSVFSIPKPSGLPR